MVPSSFTVHVFHGFIEFQIVFRTEFIPFTLGKRKGPLYIVFLKEEFISKILFLVPLSLDIRKLNPTKETSNKTTLTVKFRYYRKIVSCYLLTFTVHQKPSLFKGQQSLPFLHVSMWSSRSTHYHLYEEKVNRDFPSNHITPKLKQVGKK